MDGILFYDDMQNRFAVQELIDGVITDSSTRELHCGDCLTIRIKGDWQSTRLETDGDDALYSWYFVGIGRAAPLIGHSVRID